MSIFDSAIQGTSLSSRYLFLLLLQVRNYVGMQRCEAHAQESSTRTEFGPEGLWMPQTAAAGLIMASGEAITKDERLYTAVLSCSAAGYCTYSGQTRGKTRPILRGGWPSVEKRDAEIEMFATLLEGLYSTEILIALSDIGTHSCLRFRFLKVKANSS